MKTLRILLPMLLLGGTTQAAGPAAGGTITDYLMKMQYGLLAPSVGYCAEKFPATRAEMEKEFIAFKGKVSEATAPLLQRAGKDLGPLPAAEAAQLDGVIQQGAEKQLLAAKAEDPAGYCPFLMERLRTSTVDSLRTRIENAYGRYMASKGQAK